MIAMSALAWVSIEPHLRGRRLARHELYARQTLQTLGDLAGSTQWTSCIDLLEHEVRRIPGVRPFRGFSIGDVSRRDRPAWEDDSYYYDLPLVGSAAEFAHTPLVTARPQKPGLTGNLAFRVDSEGRAFELSVTTSGSDSPGITVAENHARARVREIASSVRATKLRAALRRFLEVLPADMRALATVSHPNATSMPVWRRHGYLFAAKPIYDPAVGRTDIIFYAWPNRYDVDGFAAYRFTRSRGLQQSRNRVLRYVGLESMPLPGAGLIRAGSQREGDTYTGADRNRWFVVAGSMAAGTAPTETTTR